MKNLKIFGMAVVIVSLLFGLAGCPSAVTPEGGGGGGGSGPVTLKHVYVVSQDPGNAATLGTLPSEFEITIDGREFVLTALIDIVIDTVTLKAGQELYGKFPSAVTYDGKTALASVTADINGSDNANLETAMGSTATVTIVLGAPVVATTNTTLKGVITISTFTITGATTASVATALQTKVASATVMVK